MSVNENNSVFLVRKHMYTASLTSYNRSLQRDVWTSCLSSLSWVTEIKYICLSTIWVTATEVGTQCPWLQSSDMPLVTTVCDVSFLSMWSVWLHNHKLTTTKLALVLCCCCCSKMCNNFIFDHACCKWSTIGQWAWTEQRNMQVWRLLAESRKW